MLQQKTKTKSHFCKWSTYRFSQPGNWYEAHIVTIQNLNCMAVIW
jgi:hypothetical protein